jgi:tripartite-type tricarboxylate transporter receptor subunit TctC
LARVAQERWVCQPEPAWASEGSGAVNDPAKTWHVLVWSRWRAGAASALLTIAAALVALALAPTTGGAVPQELRLVVAGSEGGAAHRLAEILADPLAQVLGRPVTIQGVPGDDGVAAAQAVVEAAPDGGTLLLADNLLLAVNEAAGAWPLALDALRPVAKLTLGISVALVAPADSDITWQALSDPASPNRRRLSVPTSHVESDVARALLERATGATFEVVGAADDRASLAEVAQDRADIGLVTINSLERRDAAGRELRPIVTFGARRSPLYPQTPTLAEVTGDDQNDFTYSFALFGPPELDDEVIASLTEATLMACARPAALTAAGAAGLPLACREAEVVEQTLERDLQVARRAYSGAQ